MRFDFFMADEAYCNFLRKEDPCVPYTMDLKSIRPFLGIVFMVGNFDYYAPLTSPKPKHMNMRNQVDFLKIQQGKLGAINFNNMIPVPEEYLTKVEISRTPSDTRADAIYKKLLSEQLSWCNQHKSEILNQATKLYHLVTEGKAWPSLANRCCNFKLDEARSLEYENPIKGIEAYRIAHKGLDNRTTKEKNTEEINK